MSVLLWRIYQWRSGVAWRGQLGKRTGAAAAAAAAAIRWLGWRQLAARRRHQAKACGGVAS